MNIPPRPRAQALSVRFAILLLPALLAPLGLVGCAGGGAAAQAPATDPAYVAEVETWRAQREARLTSDTGWLTVAGLSWLKPGDNVLGSDPEAAVPLPEGTCLPRAGVLRYDPSADGLKVAWIPDPDTKIVIEGKPAGQALLRADDDEDRDVLHAGRATFWIIKRGDRYGVRVRDPEAPLRTSFTGIRAYPVMSAYRVEGRLQAYEAPREILIPDVLGQQNAGLTPGPVVFSLGGQELALHPTVSSPGDSSLFFVFSDETNGGETYGGGRFLSAELEPDGRVMLDFNRAYNPPCAFNPYTTCPLPPERNALAVEVRAGEMAAHP